MLSHSIDQLIIYPSISSNEIHVNANFSSQKDYQIFNMLGIELTSGTSLLKSNEAESIIDISRLEPGRYFLLRGRQKAGFLKR